MANYVLQTLSHGVEGMCQLILAITVKDGMRITALVYTSPSAACADHHLSIAMVTINTAYSIDTGNSLPQDLKPQVMTISYHTVEARQPQAARHTKLTQILTAPPPGPALPVQVLGRCPQ